MFRSKRKDRSFGSRVKGLVLGGLGAAASMYFFDPDRGRTRRAQAKDQLAAFFRRGSRRVERTGRAASAQAHGVTQKIAHAGSDETIPPNDQALAAKVESEVLGGFPKGKININAEHRGVALRGEVDSEDQKSEHEQAARKFTGGRDVNNLRHLPRAPAPNKEPARQRPEPPSA